MTTQPFHRDANMTTRNLLILSPLVLLSACDFSLGLEIMNAGNEDITVAVGAASEVVSPGLSFRGTFPAPETHTKLNVTDGVCQYEFALPDLDSEPWHSLIGSSFKLRWLSPGRLVAYPPTPDVRIRGNPE